VELLEVIDYDLSWPTSFETLRARILGPLGGMADGASCAGWIPLVAANDCAVLASR
jgi:hypothetical protein